MVINLDEERLLRSYDKIGNEIVNYIRDMNLTWEVEMARRIYFGKYLDMIGSSGLSLKYKPFIQWLIFSYKLHNGYSLLDSIHSNIIGSMSKFEKDALISLRNTYEGLYKVHSIEENKVLVKDVFTGEKKYIWDNRLSQNVKRYSGVFTRIVIMNCKSIPLPGYSIMSNSLLKNTEEYIKERYMQYSKFNKCEPIQNFINNNSLMIHRYFLNFHV